jgi:hypothetical protein
VGARVVAGILSWHSDETLESTLQMHREAGFFGLFDETVIHFQEVRAVDSERAERFGLRWIGSEKNRHIGGGFYHLIRHLEADYLFLLEDDLALEATAERLRETLVDAIGLLRAGEMDIFMCRRHDMVKRGYTKYHAVRDFDDRTNPPGSTPAFESHGPLYRLRKRLAHPYRAERAVHKAVWIEKHPESVFPGQIRRVPTDHDDIYVVRGRATKWANPGILASRDTLLGVYDYIRSRTPGFEEYGRSLEELVNERHRRWWLRQGFRIGFTKPILLRHNRLEDGGKINY